jgi:phospholipid N-methyltransferase
MSFLRQFIKNPGMVGSVAPSSKLLSQKMCEPIDFKKATALVEYGPGTGAITEFILSKRNSNNTRLFTIEKNEDFYKDLLPRYERTPNCELILGDASNLQELLAPYGVSKVDAIVSGLPFSLFSDSLRKSIFAQTREAMRPDSLFILYQYSRLLLKEISTEFEVVDIKRVFINIPPANVIVCKLPKTNLE